MKLYKNSIVPVLVCLALPSFVNAQDTSSYAYCGNKKTAAIYARKNGKCKKGEIKLAFAAGAMGNPGTPGSVGAPGAKGSTGATGSVGPTGPAGLNGSTGGTPGPTGATGATGADGTNGSNGTNGTTGAVGPTGAPGSAGATGAAGSAGPTGSQGPAGAKGATGSQGPTGQTGSQGATGPQGPAGTSGNSKFNFSGSTGSSSISTLQYLAINSVDIKTSSLASAENLLSILGTGCTSVTYSIQLVAAPGVGKHWKAALGVDNNDTLGDNNVSSSTLCTISDTQNSCFGSASVGLNITDLIELKLDPEGTTPTATKAYWNIYCN